MEFLLPQAAIERYKVMKRMNPEDAKEYRMALWCEKGTKKNRPEACRRRNEYCVYYKNIKK